MGCLDQFYALTAKNFILRKRAPCRTIFEMIILPLFIGLLLGFSTMYDLKTSGTIVEQQQEIAAQLLAIYLTNTVLTPIFFAGPCTFLINQLVADKESKMRETMKIMSLNQFAYSSSYYFSQVILAIIMTLILFFSIWIPINNVSGVLAIIWIGHAYNLLLGTLLFGFALLSMSMALSTLFSDSKLSSQVGPLLLLFPSSIAMVFVIRAIADRFTQAFKDPYSIEPAYNLQWGYFIPHFPYSIIVLDFFYRDGSLFFLGLRKEYAYLALIANVIGWYALYEYLDAVIPNSFGIRKGFCCCFTCCIEHKAKWDSDHSDPVSILNKKDEPTVNLFQSGDALARTSLNFEGHDNLLPRIIEEEVEEDKIESFRHGDGNDFGMRQSLIDKQFSVQDPIMLKSLTKSFGSHTAVDKVSLSIREHEVFCFLGHNGAGKTTCINMMTGMLKATKGDVELYKQSVTSQTSRVRQNLGLCQQFDVLYDDLTVYEHLLMVCRIKDVKRHVRARNIDDVLNLVMLTQHKDKCTKELSGGMKRKLSLGMALIGQPRTLILDEPTSGLDVESRRQVWELILKIRQNRSIILSTQHIEEADYLSNRVCILSHGRIIALDSPDNIKKHFGVGYNLFLEHRENRSEISLQSTRREVKRLFIMGEFVSRNTVESKDSTDKRMIFQIPIKDVDQISPLLAHLETNFPQLQIDIELNSLEDAYVRIAEEEVLSHQNKLKEEVEQGYRQINPTQQSIDLEAWDKHDHSFINKRRDTFTGVDIALENYKRVEGSPGFCQQVGAIWIRRMTVFYREPRQWMMILSPFLNVVTTCLMLYAYIDLFKNQIMSDVKILQATVSILLPIFMLIGYSSTSGIYMLTPIGDREDKLRQIMTLSGLSSFRYYLALFMADFLLFLIPMTLFILFVLCMDLKTYTKDIPEFIGIMTTFGAALITFTYVFSSFFSDQNGAFKKATLIYVLLGVFVPVIVIGLTGALQATTQVVESPWWARGLFYVFFAFDPLFSFFVSIQYFVWFKGFNLEWPSGVIPIKPDAFNSMITQSSQCLFYFILIWIIDGCRTNRWRHRSGGNPEKATSYAKLSVYDDALNHAEKVKRSPNYPDHRYMVKAENITKVYDTGLLAVAGNTFGIARGSVMGLLGPNGAGKSTTFSIMAMQQSRTVGHAYLEGKEIEGKDLVRSGKHISMCPQYNSICGELTVDENLNFVARIKGLSELDREANKKLIIETLELGEFQHVKAGNLSGGNKRKLCCAQTLMLCPKIEYLDEPTTGVDPVSRRALLRMMKKLSDSSVLLTTHRMDEAEQLCDNIAIMINGRFVVYGSPSHLKKTYGHGYTLVIKQTPEQMQQFNVRFFIEKNLLNATLSNMNFLQDGTNGIEYSYKVKIEFMGQGSRLSDMFEKLAQMLKQQQVIDFTLTRTTLEQVFINFARFQINQAKGEVVSDTEQQFVAVDGEMPFQEGMGGGTMMMPAPVAPMSFNNQQQQEKKLMVMGAPDERSPSARDSVRGLLASNPNYKQAVSTNQQLSTNFNVNLGTAKKIGLEEDETIALSNAQSAAMMFNVPSHLQESSAMGMGGSTVNKESMISMRSKNLNDTKTNLASSQDTQNDRIQSAETRNAETRNVEILNGESVAFRPEVAPTELEDSVLPPAGSAEQEAPAFDEGHFGQSTLPVDYSGNQEESEYPEIAHEDEDVEVDENVEEYKDVDEDEDETSNVSNYKSESDNDKEQ